MVLKDSHPHNHTRGEGSDDPLRILRHAIDHAAHLLPAQGPITVFIHHNTLHAFEDLPFDQAVEHGANVFGCQPYLPEERYRESLATGRIRFDDLLMVIEDDLGINAVEGVARLVSRLDLRLAMLQYPLRGGPTEEILWFIAQTNALRRVSPDTSVAARRKLIGETRRWVMRDLRTRPEGRTNGANGRPGWLAELFEQFGESRIENWDETTWEAFTLEALWQVCRDGVRGVPDFTRRNGPPIRHRELLLRVAGVDTDQMVNPILIRFCAAFVDQGVAHWSLPEREKGFFHAFASLYRNRGNSPERWLRGLSEELTRLQDGRASALESILESLTVLGVPDTEWEAFISETLLVLRGWGGIIHHIETRGDRVAHPIPDGSLIDFLAVRLLLERFALSDAARESLSYTGPLSSLRDELRRRLPPLPKPGKEQRAFVVFQLAQVLGWSPDVLYRLDREQWSELVREIEEFSGIERRRVFHLAYEKRFREQTLDALALHAPQPAPEPRFQVVTCLDEREESFRRHLEEAAPNCGTFAAAGFFGVAMYYRGAADAHFVPLCPIVIRPRHWVEEQPEEPLEETDQRRKARRAFGTASHKVHVSSRGFLAGALLTVGLGVLATIPLVVRTLFPRLAARIGHWLASVVHSLPRTRLRLERTEPDTGPQNGHIGYSLAEMIDLAERQLRDIGLTRNFARLVFIIGHGSHSMNNPHESAHDCGACGGAIGGANARALAQMLNDPRVRAGLAQRGLTIPTNTVFLGALHNTCNEYVKVFDKDRLPDTHHEDFEYAYHAIERALGGNAHERARRFESAPLTLTVEGARQHMDNRAEDLAQVRPEWGHATNAICVVGRRERTRGLFLDRRAFLTSYDPTQDDDEQTILARILAAAVPVCAGINLEYYFCRVDPAGWGCGTKLPHNITSLVGVMDGAASDLRTGLPWQMVEIHEPVRLLFVIETSPEAMLRILARNEIIGRLVRNGWVQMAVLDPDSSRIRLFQNGAFVLYMPRATQLPTAASSVDWYRGWRDHLEFAEIGE
ncbi:MAG: DUF2309 domain-containing protein [Planctomycetia bacterium]|nr:DUF2309 domain-containing protein [Planctomycetia bacterium]